MSDADFRPTRQPPPAPPAYQPIAPDPKEAAMLEALRTQDAIVAEEGRD